MTNGSLVRRTFLAVTVVAVALAGCSSGDDTGPAASPSPTATAGLVTNVAAPVVRVVDPAPVLGVPPANPDPAAAEAAAAEAAELVEAAAIAVIEGTGTPSLPGDPTLTASAVELLGVLDRDADPVIDVNITPIADAGPGGPLATVTLDALTEAGEQITIEFSFIVGLEGELLLTIAEVTAGSTPAAAPSPGASASPTTTEGTS